MNDLFKSLLIALCLLAFAAALLFVKYGREKQQARMLEEKTQQSEMLISDIDERARLAIDKASKAEQSSIEARKKALENLEKAQTAAKMLEKMKSESALGKQQLMDRLNAQLEREADARIAAENAALELAKQRDILKESAEKTREAYEKLKLARANDGAEELQRIKRLLEQKDAEIAKLKAAQEELEKLRALAEKLQAETEAKIMDGDGEITLPRHRRILSPNLRTSH